MAVGGFKQFKENNKQWAITILQNNTIYKHKHGFPKNVALKTTVIDVIRVINLLEFS